ncbi:DUF2637 domain-containing protein [Kitasatospora sp. NPDC058406]|uniref:DUF2637 domain-containing protein n=1 Tax=Kitasatospora sp. NPDC058406 TaxID=3346483 RepID=UPI00366A4EE4
MSTTYESPPPPAPPAAVNGSSRPLNTLGLPVQDRTAGAPAGTQAPVAAAGKKRGLDFGGGDWTLAGAGGLLAAGVSTIGLMASYKALERKAALPVAKGGWAWEDPWMLPVGLDLSILAFSIINLVLIKADSELAWVKWVPRLGAAATVYLNWQAASTLPSQLGHAALVFLWVVFSEVAAHIYAAHIGAVHGRERMDGIRFSRWILAPFATAAISRQMKLWEITSYAEALELLQARQVYRERLRQKYGKRGWKKKARANELLPLTLAPYGLTVEQALEKPAAEEAAERLRAAEAELRKAEAQTAEELRRAEAELRRVEAAARINAARSKAEVDETAAKAALEIARAEAESAASEVLRKAEAALRLREAEAEAEAKRIAAQADADALKVAAEADAALARTRREAEQAQLTWDREQRIARWDEQEQEQVRAAEAQAKAAAAAARVGADKARAEKEHKEAEAAAAAAERAKAEARLRTGEADLRSAEAIRKAAEAQAAGATAKAEAERLAEEQRLAAALTAQKAAAAELRAAEDREAAAEAEAKARLTPAEREARKVADWIGAEGEGVVTLAYIERELGVAQTTASERRKRARQILAERLAEAGAQE